MLKHLYPKYIFFFALSYLLLSSCADQKKNDLLQINKRTTSAPILDITQANRLAELPLKCIQTQLPYKSGLTISKITDLQLPIVHHPAFYGCFDWHSSVHGHWSLVYLLKEFPNLERAKEARQKLETNLSNENIKKEIAYFSLNLYTKTFERTYGWAWLLKLQEELLTWDDPLAENLSNNIRPLADLISQKYREYLPKLVYPIRVGEHSNTGFGLSFAYDYAIRSQDIALKESIENRALYFYKNDVGCPIDWEPSGHDFLSPCLEEMDIMRKILSPHDFKIWFNLFLPNAAIINLNPAKVIDRTDGKLVHLDGLNFSRAWCLFPVSSFDQSYSDVAEKHLEFSLNHIMDGDYMGEHWLASFALYALKMKKEYGK